MGTKKILLLGCLALGISLGAEAQIINATSSPFGIAGPTTNTGLAIAPNEDIQAAVFDDGAGNYQIDWIVSASSTVVDTDGNAGNDPDVAYYGNADALVVAYEDGGDILVDDYYLTSLWPTPDYAMNSTTPISSGKNPNVDMNSEGDGILCWDDGGVIWVCAFGIGGFANGPLVPINNGSQPDVILMDDGITVGLTYVDPSGALFIETLDYNDIVGGSYTPWNQWQFPPMSFYEYPRIASERNTAAGFGAPDNFTVVAQDWNGSTAEVHGFFGTGGFLSAGPVIINNDFMGCSTFNPLPVVAYARGRVNIAWSQDYSGGCSGLWQTSPNSEDDVLMTQFSPTGSWGGVYEEVNTWQSSFAGNSRTSIAAEYDGHYTVNNTNWHEGMLFNDPGDLLWKGRYATAPSWLSQADPTNKEEAENFSLATNPVDQTIEVISESDDFATFQLLDNAGRIVELKTISNEGNNYSIDISHLSGGMYLLDCSSAAGNEVIRILQVTK